MTVITGKCILGSDRTEEALNVIGDLIRPVRLSHRLEQLAVAAAGNALLDAGLGLPFGDSAIGLYIGIDDSIEDIKDEYFSMVLAEGILGASPLLFPFTSPNALTAQISIACDLRGEAIVMPINGACPDVIEYATECIDGLHVQMAVAGTIRTRDRELTAEKGRYIAKFVIIERESDAVRRGKRIYSASEAVNLGQI